MLCGMKRRNLLIGFCCAVVWPGFAWAQQSLPIVGFLRSTPAAPFAHLVAAFREGLAEAGIVEGRDAVVEYRWGDNDAVRLRTMAADLLQRDAAVIVGNSIAVDAVRALGGDAAIVFVTADDPVKSGYVASLNQPGGNTTGVTFSPAASSAPSVSNCCTSWSRMRR